MRLVSISPPTTKAGVRISSEVSLPKQSQGKASKRFTYDQAVEARRKNDEKACYLEFEILKFVKDIV